MERSLLIHAAQLVTPKGKKALKGSQMGNVSVIEDGAVYAEDGVIRAVGTTGEVFQYLDSVKEPAPANVIDASGKCVIPGFVDSHTHFVFGGYRPGEFMRRLGGAAYLQSLEQGGGIFETVSATKNESEQQLFENGLSRLRDMLCQGVTTVEGKSGYGLDEETELKQLSVLNRLGQSQPVSVKSTYLGAHALPLRYADKPDSYIDFMIGEMLPKIKKKHLAEFCDVFCEDHVFSVGQSERLLNAAKKLGFKLKIHADEIVSLGGAELAVRAGAISADHLLMVSPQGILDLAKSDTVSTLLPVTAFCLNKPFAPARKLIDSGCAVALATDFNPGSCFSDSIPLLLALAVIHMGMSLPEALTALTINGSAALGLADRTGSLETGKQADYSILRYPDYRFLIYHTCMNIVESVVKNGAQVYKRDALNDGGTPERNCLPVMNRS